MNYTLRNETEGVLWCEKASQSLCIILRELLLSPFLVSCTKLVMLQHMPCCPHLDSQLTTINVL